MPDPDQVHFDPGAIYELDRIARVASDPKNHGDQGAWVLNWSLAQQGLLARLYAIQTHSHDLHAWLPRRRTQEEMEDHVSSILFAMDSAIECWAYGLNAIGYGVRPSEFVNISDRKSLRSITPSIIADPDASERRPGFAALFPSVQAHWIAERNLTATIMDLHDVSKHRSAILGGGRVRNDPPPGFLAQFGIEPDDLAAQLAVSPWSEVLLSDDPKAPWSERLAGTVGGTVKLEELVKRFEKFVKQTADQAVADFNNNVPLASLRIRREPPKVPSKK